MSTYVCILCEQPWVPGFDGNKGNESEGIVNVGGGDVMGLDGMGHPEPRSRSKSHLTNSCKEFEIDSHQVHSINSKANNFRMRSSLASYRSMVSNKQSVESKDFKIKLNQVDAYSKTKR